MTESIAPSRRKRRLLLAGAGAGGPLVGLLLLMTVFAGGDLAVGVAPAPAPQRAAPTSVPVPTPARDEAALLAATSDPFRQLVTVPDTAESTDATPIADASAERPAVEDFGAGAGAPVVDEPPFAGSDSSGLVTDEEAGISPPPSDEGVGDLSTPSTSVSPPTTGLPVPTTTSSSSSTLPPTTVPPTTTTVPAPTTVPATTTTTPQVTTTTAVTSTTIGALGRPVVFASVRDGNQDIYTIGSTSDAAQRLTHDRAADRDPAWAPDGNTIAFVSERTGQPEMFVMNGDGAAQVRVSANGGAPARPSWGQAGESLVFERTDVASGARELFRLTLQTGAVRRLTAGACASSPGRVCPNGEMAHGQPMSSPDGTKIAFIRSDRTGQHVLLMNANGSDIRFLGGARAANPAWSADGQRIAYDDIDGIRVVSAGGGPYEVVAATSGVCPPVARCPVFFEPSWSPDGTRLAVRDGGPGATTGDLYVIDLLRGAPPTRLTIAAQASGPRWFAPRNAAETP